jgi:hypothetical protein
MRKLSVITLLFLASCKSQTPETKACTAVENYMKEHLDDPKSYEPGKCTVNPNGSGWDVDHEFRAKNQFGALVKDEARLYVDSAFNVKDKP